MLKRPLNSRFSSAVVDGRKVSTIRATAWPVGKPIMLYNWSGAPYRSKQYDVAEIRVHFVTPIQITRVPSGQMLYQHSTCGDERLDCIWDSEGFASGHDMDEWFRPLCKVGQTVPLFLMRFSLANVQAMARRTDAGIQEGGLSPSQSASCSENQPE